MKPAPDPLTPTRLRCATVTTGADDSRRSPDPAVDPTITSWFDDAGNGSDEIALTGGMGSGGAVVRVGSTVRRPLRAHSRAVHAFLGHLESVGFGGSPRFLGIDEHGREVLSFLEGNVAIPPFPAWAATDELLVSVAELQRALHRAAHGLRRAPEPRWDSANLPPSPPDAIVCHNDLCVENVVVRDGRAVGVIDFDFAAPGSPRFDIAIAARHWVPMRDPVDIAPEWAGIDQIRRFELFCAAHGLSGEARAGVLDDLGEFLDRAMISMRTRATSGNELYAAAWAAGYPEQNRRARAFIERHRCRLITGP